MMYEIHCGDNATLLKDMPDNSIDLTVTSPPYDDMDSEFNPLPSSRLRDYKGYSWDFKAVAGQLWRLTKPGGVLVWVVGDPTIAGSESLASALQKIYFGNLGFNIHDTMIYMKAGPAYPAQDKYYQVFEYTYILSKGRPVSVNLLRDRENRWAGEKWSKTRSRRDKAGKLNKMIWIEEQGGTYGVRFNIWQYAVGAGNHGDPLAHAHPASFPEALAEDHILSWSNAGEVVLDPFCGSGTTGKAALKLGRRFIGIDTSSEYVALAKQRIAQAQPPLITL